MASLYVHIPFCKKICSYCDFCKVFYQKDMADEYLDNLEKELQIFKDAGYKYETIYIGGGTPTSLAPNQLNRILEIIKSFLDTTKEYEFSCEANPDDITIEMLAVLKRHQVNRISLGVQSFNKKILMSLGREHDEDSVRYAIEMIRAAGIKNLSVDLIYGVPKQTKRMVLQDIQRLIRYQVPHISLYSLVVENNTRLKIEGKQATEQELQRKIYDAALKLLRQNFYTRYEVSNFSLPGFECRHNLNYWRAKEYNAVGIGAHHYHSSIRFENTNSITNYFKGSVVHKEESLTKSQQILEYLMLALRLEEGISFADFHKRFGLDFKEKFANELDKLIKDGLIQVSSGYVKATDEGIMLLDKVILKLNERIEEKI